MQARDFRSIGRAAQEALRRRALVLIQDGMSQGEAARAVGVQRQTVNRRMQRWRAQGEDGMLDGRRASPRRGKGILSAAESRKVQRWIADKTHFTPPGALRRLINAVYDGGILVTKLAIHDDQVRVEQADPAWDRERCCRGSARRRR